MRMSISLTNYFWGNKKPAMSDTTGLLSNTLTGNVGRV